MSQAIYSEATQSEPGLKLPPGRILLLRFLTLCLVLGVGLFAIGLTEWFLRARETRIRRSDSLGPGMLRYDPSLGWSLAPGVTVPHRHHDFAVRYTIGEHGFRADTLPPRERTGPLHLFAGDSFTFGFGVNDQETFVHQLAEATSGKGHILNCAVPAYSTDQEALLIERSLLQLTPKTIWLVVYLGNDLLDNQYGFPLQADLPKPFFELGGDSLLPRNTPVPLQRDLSPRGPPDLAQAVLGADYYQRSWPAALEKRSLLFRHIRHGWLPQPNYASQLEAGSRAAIHLFRAIVERARQACVARGVKLRLVLMPGKSFVEQPASLAAQYQDFLRQEIWRDAVVSAGLFDLAELLRARFNRAPARWFHAHEGHLNAEGHRVVAELLLPQIENELK